MEHDIVNRKNVTEQAKLERLCRKDYRHRTNSPDIKNTVQECSCAILSFSGQSVTQLRAPCMFLYETFKSLKHFTFNSFNVEILASSDQLTFLLYSLGGMLISPKISVQQNLKLMCCPILVDCVQRRQMHPISSAERGFHCLLRLR